MKLKILFFSLIVPIVAAFANSSSCKINSIIDTNGGYDINFKYPAIAPNVANSQKINGELKAQVDEWLEKTRMQSKNISSNVTIYRCDDTVFSAVIDIESDVDAKTGQHYAHPFNDLLSFNYDVKNNKKLMLADIFRAKTDYLDLISKFTSASLLKTFAAEVKGQPELIYNIKNGTAPKLENFQHFALTSTAVLIIFPYYQVGPRYFGEPKILIPYRQLREMMHAGVIK